MSTLHHNFIRCCFTVLVSALALSLKAQTAFITEVNTPQGELSLDQAERYQRIIGQQTVVSTMFVELGNLASVQQNGWLNLVLPGKNCSAVVKAKHVESNEQGDFYWYREVIKEDGESEEQCECYDGFVNLMKKDGNLIGSISLDEDRYELQSIGEGIHVLAKKDYSSHELGCGNTGTEEFFDPNTNVKSRNNGNNCPVRVLALFTPNGNAAVPNIQNTINLSIAQTNQAFRNSNISECDLELILVGIQEIAFNEGFNIVADRDALINNTQALRNAADADIVVVYTDGIYGDIIGIAGTLTLQAERALCVIEAAEAVAEFNTSHEIAHLFACRHEPEDDPTGVFEHAHEFKTGCWPFRRERNTVMFSVATGNTIQHYSNPNKKFKKKPTGVTDERENWRQLRDNACIVADFRADDVAPLLNANISGSGFGCPCFSTTLTAQAGGGAPGPYQFAWRTSTDGFNWSGVQSTSSLFSVILPCQVGEGVYVRLTVTSSDGQVSDSFRFIEAAESWPGQSNGGCPIPIVGGPGNNQRIPTEGNRVFPNPAGYSIFINMPVEGDEPVPVMILDAYGRVIIHHKIASTEFSQKLELNIGGLADGVYFVRVANEKPSKFIKHSNY